MLNPQTLKSAIQAGLHQMTPQQVADFQRFTNGLCGSLQGDGVIALLEGDDGSPGEGGCGCGCGGTGACKADGGACQLPTPTAQSTAGGDYPPAQGMPPYFIMPQCYSKCRRLSPCLLEMMRHARTRFDEWSWLEMAKSEGSIVHFDTSVGIGPNYQTALPIAANQSMIFAQEATQQLPWEPGLVKVEPTWSGGGAPGAVTLRLYSGPRGVTGITDPTASGLIQIGNDLKLSDFKSGDNAFLTQMPELFNCKTAGIPDTRAMYIEIAAGAIGGDTLTDIGLAVIKDYTQKYRESVQGYGLVI